jgi:hypothetical protein
MANKRLCIASRLLFVVGQSFVTSMGHHDRSLPLECTSRIVTRLFILWWAFPRIDSRAKQFFKHCSTSKGSLSISFSFKNKLELLETDSLKQLLSLPICFWKKWSRKAYESSNVLLQLLHANVALSSVAKGSSAICEVKSMPR